MRAAKVLMVIGVVLVLSTGVADAAEGEHLALKATEAGAPLPVGAPAEATIKVTEPAASDECVFRQPKGEITQNNAGLVELSFPSARTEVKDCGASGKVGYVEADIAHFFGVLVVFKPTGKPKIRVGTTCVYNVTGWTGALPFPGRTEAVSVSATGELHEGGESCPETQGFKGIGKLIDPGTAELFFLEEG